MIYQMLTLSVIGMFFALGALEEPRLPENDLATSQEKEETTDLGCSCKKKKRPSLKEDKTYEDLLACEGHDEPLEEETV